MSGKRKIIFIVCLVLASSAAAFAAYEITVDILNKRQYRELRENVFASESVSDTVTEASSSVSDSVTESTGSVESSKAELFESPIDFVELQAVNSDIYSWLEVVDTDISYPVLQHPTELEYYLRRGLDCEYSNDGSLFTAPDNPRDMSGFNTIIYGHNLRSLGMFGTLKYYRDYDYLQAHRDIVVYTPYATFYYKVFAAVTYSDVLIPAEFDFDTEEGRQGFLDSLDDISDMNSFILDDMEVGTDDLLLTLSTCNSDNSQRFLVVAVLTDVES
ncbi:MAG: class B sortase [Clostridia bacterium]|nr:class B sortase [Clostridia bacterium]